MSLYILLWGPPMRSQLTHSAAPRIDMPYGAEIFIVIIKDRHDDIKAHPFMEPHDAIDAARARAKELCHDEVDYEEHDYGKDEGWLFYADYSCEGDYVKVITARLNEPIVIDGQ